MADRLSALLQRFDLRAQVFHAGRLHGALTPPPAVACFYVLGEGPLQSLHARLGAAPEVAVGGPGVLLLARPLDHALRAAEPQGIDLVGASLQFGAPEDNPLLRALPPSLWLPPAALPALAGSSAVLWGEALQPRCGGAAVLGRVLEVMLVQVLRHAIEARLVDGGLLAGLSDPRLHKALAAVHAEPGRAWTLPTMAAVAGMSRARFAAHFSHCVGMPPGQYLLSWRLGVARSLLRQGVPVKQVAHEVGYANASALGRVFSQRLGHSPGVWRQAQQTAPAGSD